MGTIRTPRGYPTPDFKEDAVVPTHLRDAFLKVDEDITAVEKDFADRVKGRLIPEGSDLDNFVGQEYTGRWYVETRDKAATLKNYPTTEFANVDIIGGPAGYGYVRQIVYEFGVDNPKIYTRARRNASAFTPWVLMGDESDVNLSVSDSHSVREQMYTDAYPLKSTEGKGVVVFRYDHGLTNIKSTLLPLHQKYDIPLYIAMNSRNWDIPENNGATQQDARDWIASGLVEFGNHSSDHRDRNTKEGIYDTIVNGRKELEEQLGVRIHGYTVPGLSEYNQFEGFGVGNDINDYSQTYAGGLILANHGIVSGGGWEVPKESYRKLDGVVRQGHRHFTWERYSFARIKQQIDEAVARKTGYTIMAHPRVMNGNGYFTPEIAEQVIAYVRQLIDAGKLARMTYYESLHATTEPDTSSYEPTIISGAGRPDTVSTLTAPVKSAVDVAPNGSVFYSSNGGGVRAWQWQKFNGNWIVIQGDTGERVLSSGPAYMSSGRILIRRERNTVTLTVDNATFDSTGVPNIPIPDGFKHQISRFYSPLMQGSTQRGSIDIGFSSGGGAVLRVNTAAPNIGGSISWSTSEPWPSLLPGTSI